MIAVVRRFGGIRLSGPISTSFSITRDEYIRAMRRHFLGKLRWKRDLVGGFLSIVGGIFIAIGPVTPIIGWIAIASGSVLLLLVAHASFILPRWMYRSQPRLKDEFRITFRDEEIEFRTNEIDSRLKWSLYNSWLCDKEFFFLYHGTQDVSVIPRRAFVAGDEDRFLNMLGRNIGPSISK